MHGKDPVRLAHNNLNKYKLFLSNRINAMLLMVLGSIIISFAGLIIRGIDTAEPLQITLYRGLALSLTILLSFC